MYANLYHDIGVHRCMLTCTTISLNVIRHPELTMPYTEIRTNSSKTLTLSLCINRGIMVLVNYTPLCISPPRNNRHFGSGCTRSMEGFFCDFFSWKKYIKHVYIIYQHYQYTFVVFKSNKTKHLWSDLFISHSTSSYINELHSFRTCSMFRIKIY